MRVRQEIVYRSGNQNTRLMYKIGRPTAAKLSSASGCVELTVVRNTVDSMFDRVLRHSG